MGVKERDKKAASQRYIDREKVCGREREREYKVCEREIL